MTLNYAQPGIIARDGVGKDALDKTIDKMRMRLNRVALQGSRYVRNETAKGGTYKESTYSSELELPRKNEDSDDLPFATPSPGWPKQATIVTYRMGIRVERAYTEDDLKGIVRKQMSGLLDSGRLLTEYSIADIMNNLTTAAGYVGADGVALAAANHPRPPARAGTWSNLESAAALSLTTFTTARANMRRRGASDFGYVMPILPKLLVVPPELEKMARDLKHAEKNPSNALNEPNTFRDDGWEPIVYDYLTSTTAWMLYGDMDDSYKGIVYAATVQPSIASLEGKDLSTDIIWGQRLRARFAVMGVDGLNLQYNAGA